MSTPNPRRVEWSGPEGWSVWADEDGVHLRSTRGDALEMPDVERLFSLWSDARDATTRGFITAPKPPTRDEIRAQGSHRAEDRVRRRAIRAIEAEFGDDGATF